MKKNIFIQLSFFMLGFGIVVGIVFPFIIRALGVPEQMVFSFSFIIICVLSGAAVGVVNILLAQLLIGRKLNILADHMDKANEALNANTLLKEDLSQIIERCDMCETSTDKIGDCARVFDNLLTTLFKQYLTQNEIRNFSALLNSNLELETMAEKGLKQLISYMSAKGGALAIEQNGEMQVIASINIIKPEKILDSTISWEALKNAKHQYITIPKDVQIDGLLASFRPSYTLIEPILYKDVIFGLLFISNDKAFDNEALNILELTIGNLATSIKNSVAHEQLAQLAARDPLTNLYNRRFGLQRLQEEYSRSIRSDTPLGIAMLDIDHFKKINDAYGHLVGDKVLSRLANLIRSSLREGDISIRYGGEEFMIILPGASIKDSSALAERLRRLVQEMSVTYLSHQIRFTISIGITSFPECSAKNTEDIISFADKALYQAKETGRNQVQSIV